MNKNSLYIRDCLMSDYPDKILDEEKVYKEYTKLGYTEIDIFRAIILHTQIVKETE